MKIFAEKGLFWWFENLKNQNLSLLTQLWCPLGSHCNCDWQGCDICNKNLNPRAFGFYQKCQSKIWKSSEGGGWTYIFASQSPLSERGTRIFRWRLFNDNGKWFVCYSISYSTILLHMKMFLFVLLLLFH